MARKKQVELTLKQKLQVLQYVKDHGERPTAIKFGISKTTVHNIKKNGQQIEDRSNLENLQMKRKYRITRNEKVNDLTIDWFHRMRRMDARISGPMLQEVALYFAEKLQATGFKASNGWLDSFKKRHNMSSKQLSGESNDVDPEIVDQFRANIQSFTDGFDSKDIFNADECGLFFKALPNRSLAIKGDKCKSGKQSKVRVSILLAASSTGEKLKPFVIGKSLKPRCFKNIKTENLPVTYTANKKAWMTSKLFENWVTSLNEEMAKQKRSILLVVDNCPAHPKISGLSNLTLKFLPANTTSEIQPMDRGIIKNFKHFYRKLLLKMVISKSDLGQSSSVLAKSVTVLDAINWIYEAWVNVKDTTIQNCFRIAGFNPTELSPDVQPDEQEIETQTAIDIDGVTYDFEEFVHCDDHIAFTQILDDDEIRVAVLDEALSGEFDDEDLIPLAELRRNMTSNFGSISSNQSTSIHIESGLSSVNATNSIELSQVSKMLQEIFVFAHDSFPEMVHHIKSCQQLLVEKFGPPK